MSENRNPIPEWVGIKEGFHVRFAAPDGREARATVVRHNGELVVEPYPEWGDDEGVIFAAWDGEDSDGYGYGSGGGSSDGYGSGSASGEG